MWGAWSVLVAAILVEVGATASLQRTDGFRNPGWTAAVLAGYGLSIWMLTLVIDRISISIAYAVWSGLGTAGIALVGVLLLGDRIDLTKALALAMIVSGVVVLNLQGAH